MRKKLPIIISYILGVLTIFTVSTVFAYSYFANQIGFTSSDPEWTVYNVTKNLRSMTINYSSDTMGTQLSINTISLSDYRNTYTFFKITTVYSSDTSYNKTCAFSLLTSSGEVSGSLNTDYKTADYGGIYIKVASTSNGYWNHCKARVIYHN